MDDFASDLNTGWHIEHGSGRAVTLSPTLGLMIITVEGKTDHYILTRVPAVGRPVIIELTIQERMALLRTLELEAVEAWPIRPEPVCDHSAAKPRARVCPDCGQLLR
jgi:hypothetical protein